MTPKFRKIVLPFLHQVEAIPSAAIQWTAGQEKTENPGHRTVAERFPPEYAFWWVPDRT